MAEKEPWPRVHWCPPLLRLWEAWVGQKDSPPQKLLGRRVPASADHHPPLSKSDPAPQTLPPYLNLCLCLHTLPTSPKLPARGAQAQTEPSPRTCNAEGILESMKKLTQGQQLVGAEPGPEPKAPSSVWCPAFLSPPAIYAQARGWPCSPEPSTGPPQREKINICQMRKKYSFQVLNTIPDSDNLGFD